MPGPIITEETHKAESKQITIDPITRLEGHGKIEIFLDDSGNVANTYFQIPELRGFEKFCIGRPVEELARITPRLCGVCPGAHHICSGKALDSVFGVEPPSAAVKLRRLFYEAHYVHSHIAHFYALAAPDYVLGPAAPKEKRNVLGVVEAVGLEIGGAVLKARSQAQWIQELLGGKATHPVNCLPGGVSRGLSEDERQQIEEIAVGLLEFAKFTLESVLVPIVLENETYLNIVLDKNLYYHESYYMGMVDENNHVNFYDGMLRVMDPSGKEFVKFHPDDYLEHIAEHVEPWSYLKFPFLKKVGWDGFKEGPDVGIYRAAPLARLNVAEGMATPLAQKEYEKFFKTLGKPVHNTLAMHWARVIELLYSAEHLLELARDDEVTSDDLRAELGEPGEGIGINEAPRGVLIHHYWADKEAMTTDLNLIVATAHNNAAICMGTKKVASAVIKDWQVSNGLLNMVEMSFRAYDPCFACATHTLPGQLPLEVNVRKPDGTVHRRISRGRND
jgi:F420-non-reducing hydrogenase large subunit